jgi:RNA recognition motif-containing protein
VRPERANLFGSGSAGLGNLSADVRASDLIGFLMHKDMDADVTIPNDFGRGRGYAFAQFNSPEAAKAAIEALDGVEFQGRRLVARPTLRALRRPFST